MTLKPSFSTVRIQNPGDQRFDLTNPRGRLGADADTQLAPTAQADATVPAASVESASKRVAVCYAEVFEALAR